MIYRAIACALWLTVLCSAQTTNWTQIKPTPSPSARNLHAMAYDSARQRTVLFGGIGSAYLGDTWEWNGQSWTKIKPAGPPPVRWGHAMAHDTARQRTVLFGGKGSTLLADTWEWDGKNWTKIKPTTSPSSRNGHAMAYDSARQRTVLFGGSDGNNQLRETWEWDGKVWTEIKPAASPPGRFDLAMVYDSARQRTVLFGGSSGGSETWEWDGKAWTPIKPKASPPDRSRHAVAYDSALQRTVLFGGLGTAGSRGDTWEYGSVAGTIARFSPYGASCGPTLAAATGSRPIIGTTFSMVTSNLPSATTAALMSAGVSNKLLGGFPILPLDLSPFGLKGCLLHHSFDASWIFPVTNGTGSFSVPVPNNRAYLGQRFYFQSAAGSVASNGARSSSGTGDC